MALSLGLTQREWLKTRRQTIQRRKFDQRRKMEHRSSQLPVRTSTVTGPLQQSWQRKDMGAKRHEVVSDEIGLS